MIFRYPHGRLKNAKLFCSTMYRRKSFFVYYLHAKHPAESSIPRGSASFRLISKQKRRKSAASVLVHHKFVLLTQRVHLFPFRTQKLSSVVPTMDHMHFGCHSWLLFQKHREWLPPTSGIVQFMNLFSIVPSAEPDYADDLWRIFNIREIKDYGALPEDTLLRRKYKEFLLAGGRQESAFGLIRMAL